MSDLELLQRHLRGAPDALWELIQRHQDMVYATCLRVLGNATDAEDAAQATFVVLIRKARGISRDVVLAGWLYRTAQLVARNAVKMRARRRRREQEGLGMAAKRDASWAEVGPKLDAALAALPAAQRDALVLRYLQDRSVAEVAAEVGANEETVAKRLSRGLARLRERLLRQRLAVTTAALGGYLATAGSQAAPAGLAAAIQSACAGAAAGGVAAALADATVRGLFWGKVKLAVAAVALAGAVATGTALLALPAPVGPRYYVDFAGGSDDLDGLSPTSAFKHAPGTPEAAGQARAVELRPGDTVLFKGGVAYRGTLEISAQGTPERPIVFDGRPSGGFGEGPAVIDGGEPVEGWRPCASPAEAAGHPDWARLYVAEIPAELDSVFTLNLRAGERLLALAQGPDAVAPGREDLPETYRPLEAERLKARAGGSAYADPEFFGAREPAAYAGGYFVADTGGVYQAMRRIEGFDPAEGRLLIEPLNAGQLGKAPVFAVVNALAVLDRPGEYAVSPAPAGDGGRRIWLWPLEAGAPRGITRSVRGAGVVFQDARHVVFRGFRVAGQGNAKQPRGVAGRAEGLLLSECEVAQVRNHRVVGRSGRGMHLYGADLRLEGNRIHDNPGCAGLIVEDADRVEVSGNDLARNGTTAIDFYGVRDGAVRGNVIHDHRVRYGNGITLVKDCARIVIEGNRVTEVGQSLTLEDSDTLTVRRNLFDRGIFIWGGPLKGRVEFVHNTVLGESIVVGSRSDLAGAEQTQMELRVVNNILAGPVVDTMRRVFGRGERLHNLYLKLDARKAYAPGTGERVAEDPARVFADLPQGDYRLRPGSPAIDAGVATDSSRDLDGRPCPQGAAPDAGAYEFTPGR
ncbi:MAG: sigma-70 family RNA polymerase sigma factor [Planctomycetota bacterium]|nr:sigma-70 family RNA polymerase sigma factor [Planctomycetota bacterium]